MITRAGWLLLAGAAVAVVAGRTLGVVELYVLAAAGVLAVGAAVARVALTHPAVDARRLVRPPRVHVGTSARVELEVTGRGPRSSPVLTLTDPVGDRAGARLRLAPLRPGRTTRASYRLPTRHRGEVPVGPLATEVTDPLGLARRTRTAAERVRLVVLPHVDVVSPLPRPAGSEPLAGHEPRPGSAGAGDEFHSLRPYVVGDDLRRVHWPMSAQSDDLVVRIDDEPRQGRLTLVLDVEIAATGEEAFERMVSAAASIATAHWRAGDMVRLLCTDGRDTGWVTGRAAFEGLLEVLALAQRRTAAHVARTLTAADTGADTVVVVAGDLPDAELGGLPTRRVRHDGGAAAATIVRFPTEARAAALAPGSRSGARVLDVGPGEPFPAAWTGLLARGRRPVRARARR